MLEGLPRIVPVVLQGARTNYFGWGCPVYCVEPSWAGIILTFLDFSLDLPCLLHWLVPLDIPPFLRGFICHCPCCCSAIFHQQILGSCRVRECPAAPRAQTALSSFAIWGNCELPSVDLLFQQLLCCNRFLIWVAICLEQALPQLLISLLIWCLLRASLNLFVRYLQGRRPEQRSRPLLLAAQDGFSRPQSSSQDLPRQARRDLDGRGKLASGPRLLLLAVCVLQTGRLSWICGQDSTQWSGPQASQLRPFAGPLGPTGRSLEISPHPAASRHTASHRSWSPVYTLQGLALRSSNRDHEHGQPRHRSDPGQFGVCYRCHPALRVGVATWRRAGRGGRGHSLANHAERGRSSFSFAFSFPSSSCRRSWKLWRRRDFWTVSFGQRTSCHLRRRYSFTDRYDSECYDHRLHSRCPAPHERVPTARGPRLQLRRGFPVCLSSHRCTFAKDPCMGSKLTRVTSRLLDARRARGGGVYSSSSEAAKKKRCRKGYAYRRWTKAQATNYGVTGVRHAGPFVAIGLGQSLASNLRTLHHHQFRS